VLPPRHRRSGITEQVVFSAAPQANAALNFLKSKCATVWTLRAPQVQHTKLHLHFRCRRQPRVFRQRAWARSARAPRHRCDRSLRALQRHRYQSAAAATRPGGRLALALALALGL
jgi:hypothetical protein